MKKKFILVVIIVFAIVVSGAFVLTKCLKKNPNHEQVNVVKEKDIRVNEIIANIYSILKPGGTAYFDVYVGSGAGAGTGQGRPTGGDKYQTFMKLEDYAEEIGEVFGQDNVEVKGKLIVATK